MYFNIIKIAHYILSLFQKKEKKGSICVCMHAHVTITIF